VALGGAVAILFFSPPKLRLNEREARIVDVSGNGDWGRTYGSGMTVAIDGGAEVDWSLHLTYPDRAAVGNAVLIEAKPEIVKIQTWGEAPSEESIRSEVWDELENDQLVSLSLRISGAMVSPESLDSFSKDGVSAWSVSIPNAGDHSGIINVKRKPHDDSQPDFAFVGDPTVRISAYEPFFTVKNVLSLATVILGPLVSIPGIFAFFRERRKDREEREKKENRDKEDSSRIILP
jgi:hypothetical protein